MKKLKVKRNLKQRHNNNKNYTKEIKDCMNNIKVYRNLMTTLIKIRTKIISTLCK